MYFEYSTYVLDYTLQVYMHANLKCVYDAAILLVYRLDTAFTTKIYYCNSGRACT